MKEQAVRQAKDLLITVLILTAATGIGNIFWYFSFTKNIISVYILGTLLTSLFTKSSVCQRILPQKPSQPRRLLV